MVGHAILTIIIFTMNNLQLFSKIKRRNRSLLTEPQQKLFKTASEERRLSPFSKLQKPLSTLDHSKILPKNILYDKQSLYLEVLSLKMELNQIMDENIRLKTRIINLEKQIEYGGSKLMLRDKEMPSRFKKDKHESNIYHEGLLVDGLKKMIKQAKRQAQVLKEENAKMKKNIRVSKINELQIQLFTVLQQNRKISSLNDDIQRKLQASQEKSQSIQKSHSSMLSQIKHLQQQNLTLKSYIKAMQVEQKYESASLQIKERKPIKQFALQRRKQIKAAAEQSKRQPLNKQSSFRISKKEHLKAMKIHYSMFPIRRQQIVLTHLRQSSPEKLSKADDTLEQRNQQLEEQIKKLKTTCHQLQRNLKSAIQKLNSIQKPKQTEQHNAVQVVEQINDNQKIDEQVQAQKKEEVRDKLQYSSVQDYQTNEKRGTQRHVEEPPRAFSEPESNKIKSKSFFKPNKRTIAQISQLLTYRMMAQRYTFAELKTDIQQSSAKQFSYIDLCHMLVNEPFYLAVEYCRTLLCFMLEKEKPAHNDAITSVTLVAKLRKIIQDFECAPEQEEPKIIQSCANVITEHSKLIKQQCSYFSNQNRTVTHHKLKELLAKLGLSEVQVSMVIGQLSICSHDLAHLNLDVLFERFDLNEIQSHLLDNHVIEEAENDDSFINSKHKDEKVEQAVEKTPNKSGELRKKNGELLESKKIQSKVKLDSSIQT